jgi:hypothetical protein
MADVAPKKVQGLTRVQYVNVMRRSREDAKKALKTFLGASADVWDRNREAIRANKDCRLDKLVVTH